MRKQPHLKNIFWPKIGLIIFGLFLSILCIEIGLRLGGWVFSSLQEYRNMQAVKQKGTYRIMCLGESTTAGEYPVFLGSILNQSNTGVKFSLIDRGTPAINTDAILSELEGNLNKYNPDMVIVMMGINDFCPRLPYQNSNTSKILLAMRSLKIYKLIKMVWLGVVVQFKASQVRLPQEQKEKSIGSDQGNGPKEVLLGWSYFRKGKFTQAMELFKKTIERNPSDDGAYAGLGWCYQNKLQPFQAEEMFKKALEFNPGNYNAYLGLGWVYKNEGKFIPAEEGVKKFIQFYPGGDRIESSWTYRLLGEIYQVQKKFTQAQAAYQKALEFNPWEDKVYGALGILYLEEGKNGLSSEYLAKAESIRSKYYCQVTRNNYLKLKNILDQRKIKLVCSQYPNRSVESLKNMFITQENVFFVDNGRVFKEAIIKGGYWDYFKDMYGGDFGHCTERGNKLLAQNMAAIILRGVFDK